MIKLNKSKKGAEMPLNTIVIALLVIIVMVVIITFFVSKMGSAGNDLTAQGDTAKDCSPSNPVILGYDDTPAGDFVPIKEGEKCPSDDYKKVLGVPNCCVKK
jgi:hypothetical protein